MTANDRTLNFTRSAIAHARGAPPDQWHQDSNDWGHVGINGYRADRLHRWQTLPHCPLMQVAILEQLRLDEPGIKTAPVELGNKSHAADTAQQLRLGQALALADDLKSRIT